MNRIRDLREDRDMRQSDLSAATGIDQRTISNYETEKTFPDSAALIRLADFFGVSIDYLVGRTDRDLFSEQKRLACIEQIEVLLRELKGYLG
ncbi:MAG: helix-turn-helix transcriptional regulator [Clostridia bacterium]|nr:helix-turn-helix transcriptional regulator [Clostridia bacterium]